jgi:hypothetical protein
MPGERTKFIKVRISEEDFEVLNQVWARNGAKTIGDFARQEIYRLLETYQPGVPAGPDERLWYRELICRLATLQAEIERLEDLLKVPR